MDNKKIDYSKHVKGQYQGSGRSWQAGIMNRNQTDESSQKEKESSSSNRKKKKIKDMTEDTTYWVKMCMKTIRIF